LPAKPSLNTPSLDQPVPAADGDPTYRVRHSLHASIFYDFCRFLCRLTPMWYRYLFARGIANLSTLVDRRLLQLKADHLRKMFPRWPDARCRRAARDSYRNFSRFMVERAMAIENDARLVDYLVCQDEGRHQILDSLRGSGAILLSGHLANWELGGAFLSRRGLPVAVVAKAESDAIDRWQVQYRSRFQITTIPVGEDAMSLLPAIRFLRGGGLLAIMGDLHVSGPAETVQFCGLEARFPSGWAVLARAANTPVVPSFMLPTTDGRYRVVAGTPFWLSAFEPEHCVRLAVQHFADLLGPHVLANPSWWFLFRPCFVSR
jgi:KDO2-lipid IV(A) lauroyltransferase